MKTALLLASLDKVRQTAPGRWIALCPAHADKTPSLAIREIDGDRILIHCFGGCSVHEVVAAVGMEIGDLFPEKPLTYDGKSTRERKPFNPQDILKVMAFEAGIAALYAADLLRGYQPTDDETLRLLTAYERLQTAVEVANGTV
jgi:DNA primase